ncbi:hypothetical protein [Faecalispora anaeroviscerum]|uniref:hypothetical protein n=1 Tax=Faecalispora anaeroviscerum TaxID=2991836 RepID=UPI0024BBE540|nr:hypothetical protein [Faecalispora anaeroviscerum]
MSSIKYIAASNAVPKDIAKKLGSGGIKEIFEVMWLGYHDLKSDNAICISSSEDEITQEWYIKVYTRWTMENRASRIALHIVPVNQYADDTMAKSKRKSPTIDFCFRAWQKEDGYFGAECKNLYKKDSSKIKRYVETGVEHFITGYYSSKSSVSAMVGYVLSGNISDITGDLKEMIQKTNPDQNLSRELLVVDPQYSSVHTRITDNQKITIHHMFFDFVA